MIKITTKLKEIWTKIKTWFVGKETKAAADLAEFKANVEARVTAIEAKIKDKL